MKRVIVPISAVAVMALSASVFADDNSTDSLEMQVKTLSAQTKQLQKEVNAMHKNAKKQKKAAKKAKKTATTMQSTQQASPSKPWPHFVTVTTTPFNGKIPAFNGADLLYNMTTINEDVVLLEQKKALANQMMAQGYSLDRPILQLSGSVEGSLNSIGTYTGPSSSNVSLSTAEIDFNAIASSWATGFMALDYDGSPISTGNRSPNSRIYLGRGFVTIGNLNVTPFYFTAGQFYVPFGRYANAMVSTPLTMSMNRILTPTALLGFKLNNGIYGSIYGFTGSQTTGPNEALKQEGVNAGYKQKFANGNSYSFGAGWVSNVADAQGQQNTGNSTTAGQFGGFATSPATNALVHTVNGGDVHGQVVLGPFTAIGEYVGAMSHYATTDLSFNGSGAEPTALHSELDYQLPFLPKKYGTALGVMYGQTWQGLALNLPQHSYATFLNTSIWRETTESIEYRHDTDYSSSTYASGEGATANMNGTGKGRNSVIAQVGMYF